MNAIETKNLTKKYNDLTAVDNINLTIRKGELFALLGVNGAGKTTTIKMLSCLITPSSGDAYIMDKSIINNSEDVKNYINVSPQETAIAPNLTVYENLILIAGIYGIDKNTISKKVNDIIEKFKLTEVRTKIAKKLSGGMQRRLSISMALITEPKILFLDEPTLGLDVLARRELWAAIIEIKGKTTIILTTHYMEEVEALADRVGIMHKGKIKETGTVYELCKKTNTEKLEDAFIAINQEDN